MTAITPMERRAVAALASIFSLRMLGLFMILPVFAIYANQLNGVTPTLIGITLGIYGLLQALLQIPFGYASDRFGRKPILIFGFIVFALGSAVAACSNSIYGVIFGRILQGASAVGCVIMALVSDLTRVEVRSRAMAMIGVSIGLSFALAFIIGPVLNEWIGIKGIFWITAGFSLIAILLLVFFVPTPLASVSVSEGSAIPVLALVPSVFKQPQLRALNLGVLVLHASLVALFLKLPLAVKSVGYATGETWQFYVPVFLCALLATALYLWKMEKKTSAKYGIAGMVLMLALSELGVLCFFESGLGLALSLGLFFTAFNSLEASLPSWVVKFAPAGSRGTALGIYSSAQFFGLFLGGLIGGWLDAGYGRIGVLLFCIILAIIWVSVHFTVNFRRERQWQEG